MAHEDPTGIRAAAVAAVARGEASLASVSRAAPSALEGVERLASQLAHAGRDDLARTLLEGVVALDASRAGALRALAEASLRLSDPGAALDAASRAHALSCGDAGAALVAARAALALGRRDDAKAWLRHAGAGDGTRPVKRAARHLAK